MRMTDAAHARGRSKLVSLLAALSGTALLWTAVVSCGSEESAHQATATPGISPTAESGTLSVKEAKARSTPTPYSQKIPSPVVVTSTPIAIATATADAAATATPQAVSAAPTGTPMAAATPTALPAPSAEPSIAPNNGGLPTPRKIDDRLDLGPFIERGYFFKRVSENESIRVYLGPKSTRKVTCGPETGTAFDSSNPTWSDRSHWIWVWVESGEVQPGCWGLSRHEDWINKPLPAEPLTVKEIRARHTNWGEDLKFAYEDSDREFSVPPRRHDEGYPRGSRKTLEDGWLLECDDRLLPWAGWTNERGFFTLALEDEEAQMREEWTPEQVRKKEEARSRGWYFIAFRSSISQGYCWQVPNHNDMPTHWPCLRCQWRSHG